MTTNHTETPIDPLRIPETTTGRSLRTRTPRNNTSNIDNDSDLDDDNLQHESPIRNRSSRQSTRYSDEHITQTPIVSSHSLSTRSVRTQKRPYYNEDTDDEDNQRAKRPVTQGRYVIQSF